MTAAATETLAGRLLGWLREHGATIADAQAALDGVAEAEFRRMWHDGVSRDDLARYFGIRKESVSERARRLGLPSRAPRFEPTEQDHEMVRLVREGLTNTEIAERFNMDTKTVTQRLSRLRKAGIDVPRRNLRPNPERDAAVRALAASGMADDAIAGALGIRVSTVRGLLGTQAAEQPRRALDALDQRILALREARHTSQQIADIVGLSRSTIHKRVQALRAAGHPVAGSRRLFSPHEDAQIAAMRADGATTVEIAGMLGRDRASVAARMSYLRRIGVDIPRGRAGRPARVMPDAR